MAGIADHLQPCLRPFARQRPGRARRRHHIITALHDHAGQMIEAGGILQEDAVSFKEALVQEVVRFQPGQRIGADRVGERRGGIPGHRDQGTFPARPGQRIRAPADNVGLGQALVIGADDILALFRGQGLDQAFPGIGEQHVGAVPVEPVQLDLGAQEHPAQDEAETAVGMCARIGQGQGCAPGAAEDQPLVDSHALADALDVLDQVACGVGFQPAMRCGTAAAALVEQDDAVFARIEETPQGRRHAAAGTPM